MDLRRQLIIARKWTPLLLASAVVAAVIAFALASASPRVYEARATLIVGQELSALNPDVNQLNVSQRLSLTYAAIATKRPALEAVIEELGLATTPDLLGRRVFAEAPTDSTLLIIVAQDSDPARAAAIANVLARLLVERTPAVRGLESELQQFIESELKATREQIQDTQAEVEALAGLESPRPADLNTLDALQGRLVTLRSTYASLLSSSAANASNLLTVIEPAIAPDSPIAPRVLLVTLLAAVVGLLFAAALAAVAEYLDDRVKDSDTVEEVAGLSTLGTVGRMKIRRGQAELYRLATLIHPRSSIAESYRALRSNIEFASVDVPVRTLLVTSAAPSEGKTVTAANLAIAFAQSNRSTILVDADLRKPGINELFRMPNERGLTTMLRDPTTDVDAIAQRTEEPNLRIISTGQLPPNPAELLGSERMRSAVERLKGQADIVIFDTPPVRVVIDAAVMSSYLDAAVLVVDVRRSRRAALRQAREALAKAGANVLGVILNKVPDASRSNEYGYYSDEAYQQPPSEPRAKRAAATRRRT